MIDKDWLFADANYVCDLRTVAVLVKDRKILVDKPFLLKCANEHWYPNIVAALENEDK